MAFKMAQKFWLLPWRLYTHTHRERERERESHFSSVLQPTSYEIGRLCHILEGPLYIFIGYRWDQRPVSLQGPDWATLLYFVVGEGAWGRQVESGGDITPKDKKWKCETLIQKLWCGWRGVLRVWQDGWEWGWGGGDITPKDKKWKCETLMQKLCCGQRRVQSGCGSSSLWCFKKWDLLYQTWQGVCQA